MRDPAGQGGRAVTTLRVDPDRAAQAAEELYRLVSTLERVAEGTAWAWRGVEQAAGSGALGPVAAVAARQWPQGVDGIGAALRALGLAGAQAARSYAETERLTTASWRMS